jgi:hypothetical protein
VGRISLHESGAARPCVFDGSPKHPLRKAAASGLPVDEETHDGPHRSIVQRLHHRGPTELPEILSGPHGDPCDWDAVLVSDEPGHGAPVHQEPHGLADLQADAGARPDLPVEHAEAGPDDGSIEQLDLVGPSPS